MKDAASLEEMIKELNETIDPYVEKKIVKDEKMAAYYALPTEGVIKIKFEKGVDIIEAIKLLPSSSQHYFALNFSHLGMGDEKTQEVLALLIEKKIKVAILNLDLNELYEDSAPAICDFIENTEIFNLSIQTPFGGWHSDLGKDGCRNISHAAAVSPTLLYLSLRANNQDGCSEEDGEMLAAKQKRAKKERLEKELHTKITISQEELTIIRSVVHSYVSSLREHSISTAAYLIKQVAINSPLAWEDIEQIVNSQSKDLLSTDLINALSKINGYANQSYEEIGLSSSMEESVPEAIKQVVLDLILEDELSPQETVELFKARIEQLENENTRLRSGLSVPVDLDNNNADNDGPGFWLRNNR